MSDTPKTKREWLERTVKELALDTSDPFTLLFANACALLDQRDQLKRELEQAEYIGNDLARELAEARQIARDAYAHNDALKDAIDSYRRLLGHAAQTYAKFDFKSPVLLTDGGVTHTLQDLVKWLSECHEELAHATYRDDRYKAAADLLLKLDREWAALLADNQCLRECIEALRRETSLRRLSRLDAYCPSCGGKNTGTNNDDGTYYCDRCSAEWRRV